jgi:hypothetical protein
VHLRGHAPRNAEPVAGDHDELLEAVKKQLSWAIETALLAYNAFYAMSAALLPVPFGSALKKFPRI